MVIYRHHRNDLIESMQTAKEFKDFEEMKNYIVEYFKETGFGETAPFDIDDIVINDKKTFCDERIEWEDVMYVCVKRFANEDYIEKYGCPQCIGMCETKYNKNFNSKIF